MGGGSASSTTHTVTFDDTVNGGVVQILDVSDCTFFKYTDVEELRFKSGDAVIFRHVGNKRYYYVNNPDEYTNFPVKRLDTAGNGTTYGAYFFVMPDYDAVVSAIAYEPLSGDDSGGDGADN